MTLFMNACAFLVNVLTLPLHIAEVIGLLSFYKRVFPLIVYKISISYNDKMNDNKRELFRNLDKFYPTKGSLRILELGCGSGANFEHYPTGCRITCIDPNPHFQKYLKKILHVICLIKQLLYYFGDGCEATRATWKHLEAAGFSDLQLRHIQAPLFFMIKPHIVGYAVK
ncbi:methyltransferase-like protein 7B [Sinocyclocheilus grahami]|uniref:methyltransferase-like protein 7B n=1 Tax=Sinocyclocheilus grahami TaxID=75366 RepID=UPI0007ACE6C8|nr:PREDICTED: methyltransferase-like protein 7B [Sinocyclocheilus grahami]